MSDRNTGYLYLPWLEGMRAVTVLAVILYGGGFLPVLKGGFTGADVFFVLSGFVISHSQTRAVMSSGKDPGFFRFSGAFYLRRFLRLIPALALCLFLTSAAFSLYPEYLLSPAARATGLSALTGGSPVFLAVKGASFFGSLDSMNPFLHTWFAGVLFSFYLLFPLLFYLWLFGGKRGTAVLVLSRILIPLLFLGSLAYAVFGKNENFLFYLLPGRLWEIGIGSLLFFLQTRWQFLSGGRAGGANIILPVGFLIILAGFFLVPPSPRPIPWAFLPVGGTLLVLWGMGEGSDKLTPIHDFLGSPFLIFWGRRAYSLYLWHWPVILFMKQITGLGSFLAKIITFVLIFLFGCLSYRFVERPFRFIIAAGKKKCLLPMAGGLIILYGLTILLLLF